MKSLKSLFALFAIAALSFGCASVTDASLNEQLSNDHAIEAPTPDNGVFSGGNSIEPIVSKPW